MLTRAALWLDDLKSEGIAPDVLSLRDRVIIGVNTFAVAAGLFLATLAWGGAKNLPNPSEMVGASCCTTLLVVAMWKQVPGARTMMALFWAWVAGALLAEPFITQRTSAAVFLPAVLSLMSNAQRRFPGAITVRTAGGGPIGVQG